MSPSIPQSSPESLAHRLPAKALRPAVRIALASFAGSALLASAVSPAAAQVFGPGPDDPALFDTVINLPEDRPSISGSVGNDSGDLTPTTQLNVASGGSVGRLFNAFSGSEVNISGGSVNPAFNAFPGSEVNISGGSVGPAFNARTGSEVNISGGVIGRGFNAESGSDVELIGGEFILNGVPYSGSTITLGDDDVFTGTLSDGSAFVFSPLVADTLSGVTLTAAPLPAPVTTLQTVTTDLSGGLSGLRAGQELTLQAGGVLRDNFAVVDATLNIQDGVVGSGVEAARGKVTISGGSVGDDFEAFSGSVVTISGGSVGDAFEAFSGSVVTISGGSVGDAFDANAGSEVTISSGNVGRFFAALSGSKVTISGGSVSIFLSAFSGSEVTISGGSVGIGFNAFSGSLVNISGGSVGSVVAHSDSVVTISGGSVGGRFEVEASSEVNLLGTEFFLNGLLLDELTLGETLTISDRDVTLSGILADGSPFSFDLNSTDQRGEDFFAPGAILTVTLVELIVPEPSALALLLPGGATLVRRRRRV